MLEYRCGISLSVRRKMNAILVVLSLLFVVTEAVALRISSRALFMHKSHYVDLNKKYGGDLPQAILDMTVGLPLTEISIAFDNNTESDLLQIIFDKLQNNDISVVLYNITTIEQQDQYFLYLSWIFSNYYEVTTLFFCNHKVSEHVLLELVHRNLIRRNLRLIFYWGGKPLNRYFIRSLHEMIKTVVVTNPRPNTYRLYYNQATSHQRHHLEMINWWNSADGLFHRPTLPSAKRIFQNFNGKMFDIPVLHKPPWHFVRYINDTIQVLGGRDDMLLSLLANRLNFRYQYFDPPDRSQGSSVLANGSFEGVLGLIGRREADFFIGDVTLTLERLNAVEFSFLTLADSVAFVTHAPSRLNEALALVRPFHWQVWPAIVITLLASGPVLYALIALPNTWQPRFLIRSHTRLLLDCCWFTITLFFKQTGRQPSSSHKSRFFIIILSLSATYIIADMYSANLTSLLAKPGRERSINDLVELEQAMLTRGYQLYVEKHSSSYGLLENGTGLYGRLWTMMTKMQTSFVIDSVEDGVQLVKESTTAAVVAGRETLFFDIQRFGAKNFHLSEKLNTAYSAIAFQIGCPYMENFNQILMAIFEGGILTKMTEDEYEKLGKQQSIVNSDTTNTVVPTSKKETRKSARAKEDNEKLQAINIKMLQGAFYLLLIGHVLSGISLFFEMGIVRHKWFIRKLKRSLARKSRGVRRRFLLWYRRIFNYIKAKVMNLLHEAVVDTLEYLE